MQVGQVNIHIVCWPAAVRWPVAVRNAPFRSLSLFHSQKASSRVKKKNATVSENPTKAGELVKASHFTSCSVRTTTLPKRI